MPTSSTTRRAAGRAANPTGAVSAASPVPVATEEQIPQLGSAAPVEQNPLGEGPASPLEICEARIREMAHHQQEALYAHAELEARVSHLEGELAHSREAERKSNDALLKCLALESRFAELTPLLPFSPSGGQLAQNIPVSIPPLEVKPKTKTRKGRRLNKSQELPGSDSSSVGTISGSDDSGSSRGVFPVRGPSSTGLEELTPTRSDFRQLVSYRCYRLENRSQRYDHAVSRRLASLVRGLRHSVEDKFDGQDPIEILRFLRSFKEAADHHDVSEGAAARLLPYFLDGIAREGYKAHLDDAPMGMELFPYMVQYLLETYATDEALTQAYLAVTTARLLEGETEKAFGHRLYKASIRAGNVVSKMDLKTIFVEGLPPFVQAGLRLHLAPDMSFDKVTRLAHDLGMSLRQTALQAITPEKGKFVQGVKPIPSLFPRKGALGVLQVSKEESDPDELNDHTPDMLTRRDLEVALASVRSQGARFSHQSAPSERSSWSVTSAPQSPPVSAVSIPTRGWTSPAGSVRVGPVRGHPNQGPRSGITCPPLCFMCYCHGHYLSDCPKLPPELRLEAQGNRETYQRRQGNLPPRGNIPPLYEHTPNPGQALYMASSGSTPVSCDPEEPDPRSIPDMLSGGRTPWPTGSEFPEEVTECAVDQLPNGGNSMEEAENATGGN